MKGKIIIEYEGDFTEEDLITEVKQVESEIIDISNNEISTPKFNTFKVSYEMLNKK